MRVKVVDVDTKTTSFKVTAGVGGCVDVFIEFHQNTFTISRVFDGGSTKCLVLPYSGLNHLEYTK